MLLQNTPGGLPAALSEALEQLDTIEILAQRGISPTREQPRRPKDFYVYHCPLPGHEDTDPSFTVHQDQRRWRCWPCGRSGGPRKLLEYLDGPAPAPIATPRPATRAERRRSRRARFKGCTLAQLARAKNLPIETLKGLVWYDATYGGVAAVAIPYPGGAIRYRVSLEGKDRFRWAKGSKPGLLGLDRLEEIKRGGWVLLVEGETDFAAGRLMGLPVVGVPGADAWQDTWTLQFQGATPYVWREPDRGGQAFADKLAAAWWEIRIIDAPPGVKDLCELHDQAGSGALELLQDLRAQAVTNRPVQAPSRVSVRDTVIPRRPSYPISDKPRGKRPTLWAEAKEAFPLPRGIKPLVKSSALYDLKHGQLAFVNLLSNAWANPVNAQHKRRKLYFNLAPKLRSAELYSLRVPFDDWDAQRRDALRKQLSRAEAEHVWFDNALSRGYVLYLCNKPLPGWELVPDAKSVLVDALRSIEPPGKVDDESRFRPYGGSRAWTARAMAPVDEDEGRWQLLGQCDQPADFVGIEAELVVMGVECEYVADQFWRAQWGGLLLARMPYDQAVEVARDLGYQAKRVER